MPDDLASHSLDNAHCRSCRYALRGLSTNKCPECGRKFDPSDPKTMWIGPPMWRITRWLARPSGWILKSLAVIAFVLMFMSSGWFDVWHGFSLNYAMYFFDDVMLMGMIKQPTAYSYHEWAYVLSTWIWLIIIAFLILRMPFRLWAGLRYQQWNTHPSRRKHRWWIMPVVFGFSVYMLFFCWPYQTTQTWIHLRAQMHRAALGDEYQNLNAPRSYASPLIQLPSGVTESQLAQHALDHTRSSKQLFAALDLLVLHDTVKVYPAAHDHLTKAAEIDTRIGLMRLIALHREEQDAAIFFELLDDKEPRLRAAAADCLGVIHAPAYRIPVNASQWFWRPTVLATDPPIELMELIKYKTSQGRSNIILRSHDELPHQPINLPEEYREALATMMISGRTPAEREAAARALLNWPPDNYQLRFAEWGVWLTENNKIHLAQSVIDEIPPFVHRLGNLESDFHDRINQIIIITKPIIHLTANQPLVIDLEVQINRGRPWFAYPRPNDFNLHVGNNPERNIRAPDGQWQWNVQPTQTLDNLDPSSDYPKLEPLSEGYPWLAPRHREWGSSSGGRLGGSNDLLSLGIRWQSLLISPKQPSWMNPPQVPQDYRYEWWQRLRDVPSSWVNHLGESERFVYYDGPTLLHAPVVVNWKNDEIILRTITPAEEMRAIPGENGVNINDQPDGPLAFGRQTLPHTPLVDSSVFSDMDRTRKAIAIEVSSVKSLRGWQVPVSATRSRFNCHAQEAVYDQDAVKLLLTILTDDGLTEAEAMGLIDAWRAQFFETPGRRVILKMSRRDYERFCPMSVHPKPTETARVGLLLYEFGEEDD